MQPNQRCLQTAPSALLRNTDYLLQIFRVCNSGGLAVQVVDGKNVPKMDYFTSSSPYVQVSTHKRGAKQVGRV